MNAETIGKLLIGVGLAIVVVGGMFWLLSCFGISLGSLPGDIRIEREGFSFYFPIVTTILLSIVLTVIVNVAIRLLRR